MGGTTDGAIEQRLNEQSDVRRQDNFSCDSGPPMGKSGVTLDQKIFRGNAEALQTFMQESIGRLALIASLRMSLEASDSSVSLTVIHRSTARLRGTAAIRAAFPWGW
ncbi:MAG TPA: hypothetical protein DCG12_09785, partial [Planctomycetaceae bacterium]|nr:hypothetical protein [Planctomycetaceae bacterium]